MPNGPALETEDIKLETTRGQLAGRKKSTKLKFAAVMGAIIVLGLVAAGATVVPGMWRAWQQNRLAWKVWNQMEEQKRREAADTYGGQTPRETYDLFVQALQKQDIDLAVKYFVFEKQGEMKKFLENVKNEDRWNAMIDDLSGKTAQIKEENVEAWYEISVVNSKENRGGTFHLDKDDNYKVWKITELL